MTIRAIIVAAVASLSFAGVGLGDWGPLPVNLSNELTAPNSGSFGSSVAIDGDTCVIGAYGTNSYTGSAYVFGSSSSTPATGACCYDGLCFSITEAECATVGGSFTAEACSADTACPTSCSSDSDNDGDVDIEDLMNLLSTFGACS
ncbi:MAG: FG-GAP repeat protein [Phycisphaerales bacterium]|nr:FG-GAP repeat protein [Phycisphaerales bacterium]